MIRAVRSNRDTFKEIQFSEGFNIILAERTKVSTDKDSRNGLGKTTLIDIIHFCLGSTPKPNEGLRVKELDNWTFILDLTLRGKDFTIYRNTREYSKVKIEGDFSEWPIKPEYDRELKGYVLKIKDWNLLLGYLKFGLQTDKEDRKYNPSFRSLISYFIRRGEIEVGAFESPFKHYSQQKEWDVQVSNSYLLGLNAEYAGEFQIIKDKDNTLRNLKEAANEGIMTNFLGSYGELEAERIRLQGDLNKFDEQLKTFKVHPQYYKIQEEADKLTNQIHNITNKYTLSQSILNKYRESIIAESDVPVNKVKDIYEECGIVFPENVEKRLNDVLEFHHKITENRKTYLQSEIGRITREIEQQKQKIEEFSNERAELLNILSTHGALAEYTKLQDKATFLRQQIEEIKNRMANLEKFEEGKSLLKIEKEELLQKTRRDLNERIAQKENAINLFNKNTEYLYSEPGILSIDVSEIGYKFKVDIKRARSQGVGYMKVFCYDLTLMQIRSKFSDMPGILIHDSTIFGDVDERQVAKAFELAAIESKAKGFQYICAINSNFVPYNDFSEQFKSDFNDYVRVKFTDATNDGGLLGIRF